MKMNLDELRVDSYSSQIAESELTNVKGGTTWGCATYLAAKLVEAVAEVITDDAPHEHTHCDSTTTNTYDDNGNLTSTSTDWQCNN
jgi:hypothetical protein